MTDAALLEFITRQPHGRTTLKHLFRELGERGDSRRELESALERLAARGELIELRSGHYAAASKSREFAAGRVSMHRDGYGFLIPDQPIEGISGDIFLGRDATKGAMNGDRAIAKITFVGKDRRAEGEIIRILRRAHPTVVGEFRIMRRGMFVAPHDERLREWIEIPQDMAIPPATEAVHRIGPKPIEVTDPSDLDGMIVNAEILDYSEDGDHPVGRVIEVLGAPDDFGVDVEIVIRKHHIPHRFPPEVIEQAQAIAGRDRGAGTGRAQRFPGAADCHHRRRNGSRFR